MREAAAELWGQQMSKGEEVEEECLEGWREQLVQIRNQLHAEQEKLHGQRVLQLQHHSEQLLNKNLAIERLQLRVHQLEKENEQLKYQHQQRITLMGTLKRHSTNITAQLNEQKRRHRLNFNLLNEENARLKEQVEDLRDKVEELERQMELERRSTIPKISGFHHQQQQYLTVPRPGHERLPDQFYTVQDFKQRPRVYYSPALQRASRSISGESQTSLGKNAASTVALNHPTNRVSDFKESTVTLVRGQTQRSTSERYRLDRLASCTHLSRER